MEPNEPEEHKENRQFTITLPFMIVALAAATGFGAFLAMGFLKPDELEPPVKTSLFRTDGDETTTTTSSPQSTQHPPVGSDPFGSDLFQTMMRGPSALGARDPFEEMEAMRERMHALMNQTSGSFGSSSNFQTLQLVQPKLEMDEDDSAYTIQLHIPNMEEGSLQINIEGQRLSITSKQTISNTSSTNSAQSQSFVSSRFSRSIHLPELVRPEGMTTEYKDDILTIHIPKTEDD